MKKFLWHSLVLAVLFVPMNVLSRIPYMEVWEKGDLPSKILVGIIVYVLWWFMHHILEVNERG